MNWLGLLALQGISGLGGGYLKYIFQRCSRSDGKGSPFPDLSSCCSSCCICTILSTWSRVLTWKSYERWTLKYTQAHKCGRKWVFILPQAVAYWGEIRKIHTCWDAGQLKRELIWKRNPVTQRGRLHWELAVGDHRLIAPPFAILKGPVQKHSGKPLGGSFPSGTSGKEHICQCRRHKRPGFDPWVGKIPWRRAWQPTPVSLPGESYGQRSLEGYSPWCCKELDTTEAT